MYRGTRPAYLIVNADDYGYFNSVSRGILELAREGIVTATGLFANAEHFDEHVSWLQDYQDLDLGVHLSLSERIPLTSGMRKKLARWGGRFPDKYTVAKAMMSGFLKKNLVLAEWREQIERCLAKGVTLRFLNSHEHMHMLPVLFPVTQALAEEYNIEHVRFSKPDLFNCWSVGPLVRNVLIKIMGMHNRQYLTGDAPHFIGLGESGRLSFAYLKYSLSRLKPDHLYELMCHPGHYDSEEIRDSRLLSYHDWESEFNVLNSTAFKELCQSRGIRRIGYKDVHLVEGKLRVARRNG